MSSGISSNADKKVKVNAYATPRSLNFTGSGVSISENPVTNAFDITISGGSGEGGEAGPHATTHHDGGTDPLTLSSIAGSIGDSKITDLAYSKLTSVPATFTPSTHNHAGEDINSGTVGVARLPSATESTKGVVELATSAETTAGLVIQASDTRLSDSRTPTVHTHAYGDLTSIPTSIVKTDQTNTFGAFAQTFPSSQLKINNPANTFAYTIIGAAIAANRNLTLPLLTGNDTVVTAAFTQTLTNKTLTTPIISSISNSGTVTIPTGTNTLVGRTTTDTLTNKTISGTNNTITDIPYTSLTSVPTSFTPSAHATSHHSGGTDALTLGSIDGTIGNAKIDDLAYSKLTGVPADPTTATNVGTGEGTIFRNKTDDILNLKKLQAGSNVTITNEADQIIIASTGTGEGTTGAPVTPSYITLGLNGDLTAERVLTQGTNISFVDAGANNTLTLNVPNASETTKGAVELATSVETTAGLAVQASDTRLSDARTPTTHNHSGADITSGTVPIAQLPVASESTKGIAELATSVETTAGLVVQASDTRLSDTRTPTAHATSHHSGGGDALALGSIAGTIGNAKIDDLAYSKLTSVPTSFTPSVHASSHLSNGTDAIAAATETVRGTVELATSAETTAGLVVQASDTRLSDSRTPSAHAATHLSNGSDPIAVATTAIRGTVLLASDGGTTASTVVQATDARLSNARTPTAHNHAGADINSGTISNTVLPAATTAAAGISELATSAETTAGLVVQASDTRLSDARTPTAHDSTHHIDTIGSGTDITTNNATISKHGLLPKGSGVATEYLNGNLIWATPAGGSEGAPTDAQYLTLATNATLTVERVLTQGTNISFTDGGAGSTLTVNVPDGSTTTKGAVELATDGETASGVAVQGNDTRLSNSRTPTSHKDSHKSGGGDAFTKTDILNAPSRYIEQIADPASDSGRIWINSNTQTIEYWDTTTGTPVQREITNTNSTQTQTNKTLSAASNTITATSVAAGAILKANGTKYDSLVRGTSLQVLRTNSGATDIEWASLDSERTGKATANGDGSTTVFTIAHGLGATPGYAFVDCSSHAIARTWVVDGTNITVTFTSAPGAGSSNVVIYWRVIAS